MTFTPADLAEEYPDESAWKRWSESTGAPLNQRPAFLAGFDAGTTAQVLRSQTAKEQTVYPISVIEQRVWQLEQSLNRLLRLFNDDTVRRLDAKHLGS